MHRLTFLDGLRVFLAWTIVVIHVLYFTGFAVGSAGPYVVNTFIVLSGFVIAKLLIEKREPYLVFMTRRLFRLFPVYLVCLGLAIALRPWTLGSFAPEAAREVQENAAWGWHLLAHLSMLHGLVPEIWLPDASYCFLPPAWAVSVELQLYLIAPFMVWLLVKSAPKVPLLVGFGSLAVLITPLHWRLFGWDHMGGCVLQKFYLFLGGALLYHYWPNVVPKWQAPRWVLWLSEISYSTYLVHFPILAVLNAYLPASGSPILRAALMLLVAGPLIVASSAILYYRVEKPGVALGKALTL
jgi:peptidoglycan/LPS O-acetylase OafA/YrhL